MDPGVLLRRRGSGDECGVDPLARRGSGDEAPGLLKRRCTGVDTGVVTGVETGVETGVLLAPAPMGVLLAPQGNLYLQGRDNFALTKHATFGTKN